jgi:hypothetical protein
MPAAAFVFSGQVRSHTACFENIQMQLVQPLHRAGFDVDVFFHTWEDENVDAFHNLWPTAVIHQTKLPEPLDKKEIEKSGIKIGRGSNINANENEVSRVWKNLCWQWCNVLRSFELFERQRAKDYDVIFRLRPDAVYKQPLDVGALTQLSSNCIHVGKAHTFVQQGRACNVNNIFAFGRQEVMLAYGAFYTHLMDVTKTIGNLPATDVDFRLVQNYSLNNYFRFYLERMRGLKIREMLDTILVRQDGRRVSMTP